MILDGLPSSIRVGPYPFAIKTASLEQMTDASGESHWGECDTATYLITIMDEYPSPARAVDTVLHEISHAIYHVFCLDDDEKEERVVTAMGRGLTLVFLDNPALVAWISRTLSS